VYDAGAAGTAVADDAATGSLRTMRSLVFLRNCCFALGLASAAGCAVDAHDDGYYDDPPPRGSSEVGPIGSDEVDFSVEWTIDGSNDPNACLDFQVDTAYVTIEDDAGIIDETEVPCEDFAYDAPSLPPNTYWATVTLRDRGVDATSPGQSAERDLFDVDSDYVVINFDPDSFF
jgi:hypothetical protein